MNSRGPMSLKLRALQLSVVAGGLWLWPVLMAQSTQPAEPDRDPVMLMSRAVLHYNRAARAASRDEIINEYQASIRDLSGVLRISPQLPAARFLLALAHGQLALLHEDEARAQRGAARLARADRREADATEAIKAAGTAEHEAVTHYDQMASDLDELLKAPPREEYAIAQLLQGVDQLLNGVTRAKLARFQVEDRVRFLRQAEQSLESYLRPQPESGRREPTGLNRVRGEYFLGVVLYRLALKPADKPDAPEETVDPQTLDQAGQQMLALTDQQSARFVGTLLPPDMPRRQEEIDRWLSYPNLYLGLIRMRQGNQAARRRQLDNVKQLYAEAEDFFQRSRDLDDFDGRSLSDDAIPRVTDENRRAIQEALAALEQPGVRTYVEDFRIDWRSGFAYDTNVILLGENTITPPDIGRKRDVLFGTGVALSYTLDLGKIDPSLDRWSVGMLGRAFSNWHGDISEYNEQDYGGSVALQYELMEQNQDGNKHGPLTAGIQYDYDYFFLGNNGFVRDNRVTPRLTMYTFDQRLQTTLGFRYEDRNYLEPLYDTRFDRDGNYFAFTVVQAFDALDMTEVYGQRAWGLANDPQNGEDEFQRWLRPYIGFEYGWDSTIGDEFDEKRYLLAAGARVPLPYGVDFDVTGEWEWQNYGGWNGGSLIDYHRRGREDMIQRYGFGLERKFVLVPGDPANRNTLKIDRLVLLLRGDILLTDDDSNVEDRLGEAIFSYDRAVYGLSVGLQFDSRGRL